jgi:hypothetical protein
MIICGIVMCTNMTYVSKCTVKIPVFFNYITRFEVLIVVLTPSHVVYYMPPCILVFSNVSQELVPQSQGFPQKSMLDYSEDVGRKLLQNVDNFSPICSASYAY